MIDVNETVKRLHVFADGSVVSRATPRHPPPMVTVRRVDYDAYCSVGQLIPHTEHTLRAQLWRCCGPDSRTGVWIYVEDGAPESEVRAVARAAVFERANEVGHRCGPRPGFRFESILFSRETLGGWIDFVIVLTTLRGGDWQVLPAGALSTARCHGLMLVERDKECWLDVQVPA